MSGKSKTHYRKVFKSDHLGVADLEDFVEEGSNLIFTISHVRQEFGTRVAGRKGNFNIAYFKEGIKPLVLNATNSKTMKSLSGGSAFVEDWSNIPVQLYIDAKVKMKGDIVGGVRISPNPPRMMSELKTGTKAWENAKAAYIRDKSLDAVKKRMIVTPEAEKALIAEVENVA
jgi:hypothetical protein